MPKIPHIGTFGTSRYADDLQKIGFERAATWVLNDNGLNYEIVNNNATRVAAILSVANALYAFCAGKDVLYIGKTTQTLKKRLKGYCSPGKTQSTNQKCHAHICSTLLGGREVDIYVFAPPEDLRFRGFSLNIAAGLEDTLIRSFAPPWNGAKNSVVISESAEHEAPLADNVLRLEDDAPARPIGQFWVTLTPNYLSSGIINPGKATNHLFGRTDAPLTVCFSDGAPAVASRIDRRANSSGSVRLLGSNQAIATWLQKHFQVGDRVTALIISPYLIELQTDASVTPVPQAE